MNKVYKELKTWYEKKSGTEITDEEALEAAKNLLKYFRVLDELSTKSRQDSNSKDIEIKQVK